MQLCYTTEAVALDRPEFFRPIFCYCLSSLANSINIKINSISSSNKVSLIWSGSLLYNFQLARQSLISVLIWSMRAKTGTPPLLGMVSINWSYLKRQIPQEKCSGCFTVWNLNFGSNHLVFLSTLLWIGCQFTAASFPGFLFLNEWDAIILRKY